MMILPPAEWDLYADEDIDAATSAAADLRHGYGASDLDLDDKTIRNARHAYYGSVSDIDNKVAGLLQVLEESGFKDNTIVVFTSDHGDMLGEQGMWFKMSFLEHSARVPLIIHDAPRRTAVSLVDLLPTLVDMATDGRGVEYATPIEGRSLSPHLAGDAGHNEAVGEYRRRKPLYASSCRLKPSIPRKTRFSFLTLAMIPTGGSRSAERYPGDRNGNHAAL